jgi:hypothetical protein
MSRGRGGLKSRSPRKDTPPVSPNFAGGSVAPLTLTQSVVAAESKSYFLGFFGRYPSGRVLRLLVGFFFWNRIAPSDGALILAIRFDAA